MSDQPAMTYEDAARLYDELETRAAARRRRTQSSRSDRGRRSRRRLAYGLAVCGSAAAAVGVALVLAGGGTHHHPATSVAKGGFGRSGLEGFQPVPIGTDPLPGGRSVSLAEATRLLGSTVPTPNAPLANPDNLSVVWGIHGEVMLDYVATQIRISIEPANRILRHNALAAFRKMAKDDHMSPGALTISGDPAVADGDSTGHAFAQVVRDGLSIAVMGHRSPAQLITIARSLSTTGRD